MELSGVGIQTLKIPRSTPNHHFYVALRMPIGFDAHQLPNLTNKVHITSWAGGNTNHFSALDIGNVFTSVEGIEIHFLGLNGDTARVSVYVPPDTTPPSIPTLYTLSNVSGGVSVKWSTSMDVSNPIVYSVYKNGTLLTKVSTTSFTDSNVVDGQIYTYYVEAVDAVGNVSRPSNSQSITYTPPTTTSKGGGKTGGGGGKKK
jgi:predicted phage tail protein